MVKYVSGIVLLILAGIQFLRLILGIAFSNGGNPESFILIMLGSILLFYFPGLFLKRSGYKIIKDNKKITVHVISSVKQEGRINSKSIAKQLGVQHNQVIKVINQLRRENNIPDTIEIL